MIIGDFIVQKIIISDIASLAEVSAPCLNITSDSYFPSERLRGSMFAYAQLRDLRKRRHIDSFGFGF